MMREWHVGGCCFELGLQGLFGAKQF